MIAMRSLIDKRFKNRLRARYEKYDVQAGILKNEAHRQAKSRFTKSGKLKKKGATTNVDGMKARRKGSKGGISIAALSVALRKRTGVNIWTAPFRKKHSREVKRFLKAFIGYISAPRATVALRKRAEMALVEVIRAPIKRREYGRHSRAWAKVKGFQRRFFDTGQLYMAIKAKIKRTKAQFGPFQQ